MSRSTAERGANVASESINCVQGCVWNRAFAGCDASSPPTRTTDSSDGHASSSSASSSRRSGVVIKVRTSQSPRMYETCCGRRSGLTGTNTPPAAEIPKMEATVSIRLSRKTATRSSRSRPSSSPAARDPTPVP